MIIIEFPMTRSIIKSSWNLAPTSAYLANALTEILAPVCQHDAVAAVDGDVDDDAARTEDIQDDDEDEDDDDSATGAADELRLGSEEAERRWQRLRPPPPRLSAFPPLLSYGRSWNRFWA